MKRGRFLSSTLTGRLSVAATSRPAVNRCVSVGKSGRSDGGVFMGGNVTCASSGQHAAQYCPHNLFGVKKRLGDSPRGAAVLFVITVYHLKGLRCFRGC